jgi:hypothetical protein
MSGCSYSDSSWRLLLMVVGTDYQCSNFPPNWPVGEQIDERHKVLGRWANRAWLGATYPRTAHRGGRAENRHELLGPAHGEERRACGRKLEFG